MAPPQACAPNSQAKLRRRACVVRHPSGLDRTLLHLLTQDSYWVRQHQNVYLIGLWGIGKSFLPAALAERLRVQKEHHKT